MTESEWLTCTDPNKMLQFLGSKASERKLRLLACAYCRRIWDLLGDERSRGAVEIAEKYADGLTDRGRLSRASDEAREARRQFMPPAQTVAWRAATAAQDATRGTGRSAALNCMAETSRAVNGTNEGDPAETQRQALILRDIFGNPFRPVNIDPSSLAWNGDSVVKLAEAINDDRALDRLPSLAEALQEAGCDNPDILDHCRGPGPHVRGCWVVDLVLGKQ